MCAGDLGMSCERNGAAAVRLYRPGMDGDLVDPGKWQAALPPGAVFPLVFVEKKEKRETTQ